MSEFIITYHGGKKPETQEEGMEQMAKWKAWIAELGAALTNPGTPVGITKVLTSNGTSSDSSKNPMSGFSIIEATDMATALDLIKNCPVLGNGGTMEVSEMMQMPG